MLESLWGRQGEDRRGNLGGVTVEKFSTMLCGDKVNKERGSTKGSLQEPWLCHHQGQKIHNPHQAGVALRHHAQSWLVLLACSPTKTSSPPSMLSASVWMLDRNLNNLHLGESRDVGQLGLSRDEFPGAVRTQAGTWRYNIQLEHLYKLPWWTCAERTNTAFVWAVQDQTSCR